MMRFLFPRGYQQKDMIELGKVLGGSALGMSGEDNTELLFHPYSSFDEAEATALIQEKKWDVNWSVNSFGHRLIFYAVTGNCIPVTKFLIKMGAELEYQPDVNTRKVSNASLISFTSCLFFAARNAQDTMVETLLEQKLPINAINKSLMIASSGYIGGNDKCISDPGDEEKQVSIVASLIKAGADVNFQGEKGMTPLHQAMKHGRISITDKLLELGARFDLVNHDKNTPMEIASSEKVDDIRKRHPQLALFELTQFTQYCSVVKQWQEEDAPAFTKVLLPIILGYLEPPTLTDVQRDQVSAKVLIKLMHNAKPKEAKTCTLPSTQNCPSRY